MRNSNCVINGDNHVAISGTLEIIGARQENLIAIAPATTILSNDPCGSQTDSLKYIFTADTSSSTWDCRIKIVDSAGQVILDTSGSSNGKEGCLSIEATSNIEWQVQLKDSWGDGWGWK